MDKRGEIVAGILAVVALGVIGVGSALWSAAAQAQPDQSQAQQQVAPQYQSDRPESPLQQQREQQRQQQAQQGQAHTGEVVQAGEGQLSMTIDGRQQHTHKVASNARITINGQPAGLEDLRRGDMIRVTMAEGNVAIAIEARRGRGLDQPQRERTPSPRYQAPGSPQFGEQQRGYRPSQRLERGARGGAWLGIRLQEAQEEQGVLVVDVFPRSPAAEAGIRAGDVIVSIDGREATSVDQVVNTLGQMQPEAQVELVLLRNGQQEAIQVQLGAEGQGSAYRPAPEEDPFESEFAAPMQMDMMCEECARRAAEQHERIEMAVQQLTQEVRQLRQQLAQTQRGGFGPESPTGEAGQFQPGQTRTEAPRAR